MKRAILAVVLALSVVSLVGCGGGSPTTKPAASGGGAATPK